MSKFLGTVNINTGPGGDEGGEIVLAPAVTNTTVSGNVVIDVYQNKLRIFESGGNNRGAYIDLTAASNGVASNLLAGGGGATTLDGLTDVVITSPEEFQGLSYNGTSWVNSHIPLVSYVRNAESTTLTTGTAVYLFGSTGDHASVKRADNDSDTTSSKVIGLVGADIAASQNGPVITRGYVDGIDLSVGYTAGDILWLGEDGGFTKTKPTAPEHLVFIGVVVRATNNGIVYVATQNGYELDEIHNVDINPSTLASGDFLKYNGTLWVNDPINLGTDTVGDYVASLVAGTGITLSNNSGESATPTIAVNDSALLPAGMISPYAGSSAPSGWLLADGTAVSRSTYAALFAAIGTTYGAGNGSTTFNLPNLKGRVPVGLDSTQTEFDALNDSGGAKTVTLTGAQSGTSAHGHGHNITGSSDAINANSTTTTNGGHSHSTNGRQAPSATHGHTGTTTVATAASNSSAPNVTISTDSHAGHAHVLYLVGGVSNSTEANATTAHENMPPYIVLNYIIKV